MSIHCQTFDASKLFSAVVNSTREYNIIEAVATGTHRQQLAALEQLLSSNDTPRYLVDPLRVGYNMIASGRGNFHSAYTPASLTGSGVLPYVDGD